MLGLNPILRTDSYKASHFLQYPPGTEFVSSYIESRGGPFTETVFFGLQAFIMEYLTKPITISDVHRASALYKAHGVPFNLKGWMRIVMKWDGYLPIIIKAVPEGTVMRPGNCQVQVINTDPELPWLTSYVETALLRAVWYPSTVATISREAKKNILAGLRMSSDDPNGQIPFKLHDFGARGATSSESAMLGGMAHLVNFMGTDTVEALIGADNYYNAGMAGFSIPAAEHSTMTAWGRENERDAYKNMLDKFPTGMVAVVSDSYSLFNAVEKIWGKDLKNDVKNRDGVLIVRPDSGDPVNVPVEVIKSLMDCFGYSVNSKGYRVLPDYVRVIQGDGMNLNSIKELVNNMLVCRLSLDNLAFGMGGGLLQKCDRDTLKYAMKSSAIYANGEWKDVYKDPATDHGKKSKRGILAVVVRYGKYVTIREDEREEGEVNVLELAYHNGEVTRSTNFETVRRNASI